MLEGDVVKLTPDEAHALGSRALRGIGLADDESTLIADHLVDNMLCGYDFAGLPRIIAMADHPYFALPRTDIRVVHETPLSASIDGGNHPGYAPVLKGADLAAEKALAGGMALVGVNNCWFSGRNAYYLERIVRRGLVAIHTASGYGNVVPPGATKAALGTNPIGFAIPSQPHPLIFDMGTAATMWGEVLLYAMLGKDFPEGIGVDASGRPTTSAKEIARGGVLPFAGHKGFGLSLMVQALGVLAGARRARGDVIDSGFLFIAIDPALLMPREQFEAEIAEMIERIKGLPRLEGVDDIRIPSQRAFVERERRRVAGMSIPVTVHRKLLTLAGG